MHTLVLFWRTAPRVALLSISTAVFLFFSSASESSLSFSSSAFFILDGVIRDIK